MSLSLRIAARRGVLAAAMFCAGACSSHAVDIITKPEVVDPCAGLDQAQCAADTADGCSFQPSRVGCTSADPSCGPGVCQSGDPFVRRNGEQLFLHGKPFSFVGTVSWGLAWADDDCEIPIYASQADALGPSFTELATMRTSVLRVWAFQSYAGPTGKDYSHFDRLISAARAAGVRLLPVLENMHPDCTARTARDDAWFAGGYK